MTQHFGVSDHYSMPLVDRIALYRRVLGFLAFSDYKRHTLTFRMQWDLDCAVAEAQLINRDNDPDPAHQRHKLRVLLSEALNKLPKETRNEIYDADSNTFKRVHYKSKGSTGLRRNLKSSARQTNLFDSTAGNASGAREGH